MTRLKQLRHRWRRTTASLRTLPDFVIVGAQKAGTTSLYDYLVEQPDVLAAASKEVHFFDSCDWDRGLGEYRASFPMRATLRVRSAVRGRRAITGEATPYYLYHPLAPERLAETVPHAKIVILLRDPVERALSHYWHEVRRGSEHLELEQALDVEESRLRGREAALRAGVPPCRHRDHQVFSYVDRSRYSHQVARYLQLFPSEQVLVLKSELLFSDDPGAKRQVAAFLGLPELVGPFAAANLGHRKDRSPVESAARARLRRELADDEAMLAALVGPEFRWSRPAELAREDGLVNP